MKPIFSVHNETSLYYLVCFEYPTGGYCVEWTDKITGKTIHKSEYHSRMDASERYEYMNRLYMYELAI